MRHEKRNNSPQIYEAPKALTVLIVQQPQTINLFKQIKLPRTWNRFCFAFWAVTGRAASLLHHKIWITAPSRQETRTAHTNTHTKKKHKEQHRSSMYGGPHFPTSPATLGRFSSAALQTCHLCSRFPNAGLRSRNRPHCYSTQVQ